MHASGAHDAPDCRDHVFVTEDLAARVIDALGDSATRASDHQPVIVALARHSAHSLDAGARRG